MVDQLSELPSQTRCFIEAISYLPFSEGRPVNRSVSVTFCASPPSLPLPMTMTATQDVETVDPVLNPLLNRELQRTGGRTLIRLGSEDIDYSPDFVLLLVTRNPDARFAPDLCSRVTIVNFTITPASLQSQVCQKVLCS